MPFPAYLSTRREYQLCCISKIKMPTNLNIETQLLTKNDKNHSVLHKKKKMTSYSASHLHRGGNQMHPLLEGPQEINSTAVLAMRTASKTCLTEFTQRVMSGKLLQLRQFQNQLIEANNCLKAVKDENKGLNRLVKRQESRLRRYEGENAGMPRLLHAHADEVRSMRAMIHHLRTELRDVQTQLRGKEADAQNLKHALHKLRNLAHEKKLFDYVNAEKKIVELEELLCEQKKEIQLLSRQLLLESKNHQRLLQREVTKHRETKQSLEDALTTILRLEKEKKTLVLGYTTANRPIAHRCAPPANKEQCENEQKRSLHNSNMPSVLNLSSKTSTQATESAVVKKFSIKSDKRIDTAV